MKSVHITIFLFFVLFLTVVNISAQEQVNDTIPVDTLRKHSITKATLMSTVLPGLGQVYNKKYWKTPIIYSAIGASLYFAFSNNSEFKKFKTALGQRVDNDPFTIDQFDGILTDDNLRSNIDFHQRNRDLSFILAGLFYVLNIVDAAVDAHLFYFPKNDNLSFNLQPVFQLTQNNTINSGIGLVVNL